MSRFLLTFLGAGDQGLPEDAQIQWLLTTPPTSWRAVLAVVALAGILWYVFRLYLRTRQALSFRYAILLAGLRAGALLMIAAMCLGPAVQVIRFRDQAPALIVLVDESRSMSIRDENPVAEEKTTSAPRSARYEVADRLLRPEGGDLLRSLSEKGIVHVFTFADTVRQRQVLGMDSALASTRAPVRMPANLPEARPVPPLSAAGEESDIERGLRESIRSIVGRPLGAVVLLSDGRRTAGVSPLALADELAEKKVPLFAVGLGSVDWPANLRIESFRAPRRAFQRDPISFAADISARGMLGRTISLELVQKQLSGGGNDESSVVATQSLNATTNNTILPVNLEHAVTAPGRYLYSLRVRPEPDEMFTDDNHKSVIVEVLRDQARVLLVGGYPHWDYRLVRDLLMRDGTIQVACLQQNAAEDRSLEGTRSLSAPPQSADEWMDHDAILLLDPDPAKLPLHWSETMTAFVGNRAGGVLWSPGPTHGRAMALAAHTRPFVSRLPVIFDPEALATTARETGWHDPTRSLRVMPDTLGDVLVRLGRDVSEAHQWWQRAPAPQWGLPGLRAGPAGRVLVRCGEADSPEEPVLVTGRYGAGRTIYLGMPSTWRWRSPDVNSFDQFWIQAIRYLLEGRQNLDSPHGRLSVERDRYSLGEEVVLSLQIHDASLIDRQRHAPMAKIVTPEGEKDFSFSPLPTGKGRYECRFLAFSPGASEAKVKLMTTDGDAAWLSTAFRTETMDVELSDPRLDEDMLRTLAERTGGRYLLPSASGDLAAMIPDRLERIAVPDQPRPIWNSPVVLLLVAGFLCAEWALRRKARLL